MTGAASSSRPSLARTVSFRIAVVAIATLLAQLVVVILINYFDYDALYWDHITYETRSLMKGVESGPDGLSFVLPPGLSRYRDEHRAAYAFRVIDSKGNVVASAIPDLLEPISPWTSQSVGRTTYWFTKLGEGGRFHFAGGRKFSLGNGDVLIEVATLGDPSLVHWWVVARETFEDMWLPILPFAVLIPVITLVSIRRALNPLVDAARQAEAINPGDAQHRFDLASLPHEAAAFASAIDRLMRRIAAVVSSQKVFFASAAHELRTPLAVMLLELEKIDHPRARRLERDVAGMSESVNCLLLLARFDIMQRPDIDDIDIGNLVKDTIDRLKAWAAARGQTVDVRHRKPSSIVRADPIAIREALRNLVENAVRHTPAGTKIRVTVGPSATITVEDSGPGLPECVSGTLFEPFRRGNASTEGAGLGLTIVRRAIELHGGSIETGRSVLGGAMFILRFSVRLNQDDHNVPSTAQPVNQAVAAKPTGQRRVGAT